MTKDSSSSGSAPASGSGTSSGGRDYEITNSGTNDQVCLSHPICGKLPNNAWTIGQPLVLS
jgi:hypothetical protein